MAIMRDIMRGIMRDIMRGVTDGLGGIARIFYAPLTSSLVPVNAVSKAYTFTRSGTDATVTDFEGLVKNVTANEARFVGARRVENLVPASEDFTDVGWIKTTTTATADQLTATAGNATTLYVYTAVAGDYVFSVELKRVSGTGNIQIAADSGTYTTVTLTNEYQRFSVQQTIAAGIKGVAIRIVTSGDSINARNAQLEFVEGQANQNPSEYVSVGVGTAHGSNSDGVKYFTTENGNTVTSNVVTEATGAAIPAATLRGVLLEEARTNILLRSAEFDNAYWGNFEGSVSADTQQAPDGTLSADTFTVTSATPTYPSFSKTIAVTGSAAYTLSCYFKAGIRNTASIELRGTDSPPSSPDAVFTLSGAGSVLTIRGTAGIELVGNGWYRCWVTITTADASEIAIFGMGRASVEGVALGDTIHAWGAQLEAGDFITSYVPTVAATATRNIESLTYSAANIPALTGSIALSFTPGASTAQYVAASAQRPIIAVRGASADLIYLQNSAGKPRLYDGTNLTAVPTAALVAGTTIKLAGRWSASELTMDLRTDAQTRNQTYDGNMGPATEFRVGGSTSTMSSGSIKNLGLYNSFLPDGEFEALTA